MLLVLSITAGDLADADDGGKREEITNCCVDEQNFNDFIFSFLSLFRLVINGPIN